MTRTITIVTLSTMSCSEGRTCPAIHALSDRPDVYHLVVSRSAIVTDPDELAALSEVVADNEMVITQPREVIDNLLVRS